MANHERHDEQQEQRSDCDALQEEIRRLNDRLRDSTARMQAAEAECSAAVEQRQAVEAALQETDRRKDQFLAMLGHELRNPLAPIRNAAEMLDLIGRQDPVLREITDVLKRQSNHMARIIDDLLDVSRVTRGKIVLHSETIDWGRLVREEAHDASIQVADCGLSLEVQVPQQPVWVRGDPTRLTQILSNLLNNAVKFTEPGGRISIELQVDAQDNVGTLTIADTGIGIESHLLPAIFESFSQADQSLDRTRGGLGLGLAVVRGLVEMHGGHVFAQSGGLHQGTQFVVRLPLVEVSQEAAAASTAQPTISRHRILVIDDRRDSVRMLQALLEKLGQEVHVAMEAQQGLELAKELHPELIISDIGLPRIDGYQLAKLIRSERSLKNVLLVAVTGYGQPEDERRAFESGFDLHLTKPVDLRELQSLVASLDGHDPATV